MADANGIDRLEALADEGSAFISAIRAGESGTPIAACPGWDIAQLADHTGTTWRWATKIVGERLASPAGIDPVPPMSPVELIDWLEVGLAGVLETLGDCPSDEPVWGFGLHPRTAEFWRRRQAMETAVHRVDAQIAIGRTPRVSTDVAADGIGEFVDVLLPRLYRGKEPPAGQLRAHATDSGGTWATGDPAGGVASLTGTAEDLFLVLWNRRGIDTVASDGDPAVLKGWRDLGGM